MERERPAISQGPDDPAQVSLGAAAVRGSVFNTAQWLLNKLLTAGSMLLLAHWLSPGDFGVASQASAIVQFMAFCLPLTLGDVLLARFGQAPALARAAHRLAVGSGLLNTALIVACMPLLLTFYSDFPPRMLGALIAVLALRPLLEGWQMLPLTRLRMRLAYGPIAMIEGAVQGLSTLASIVMAALGAGSAALAVPTALGGVVRAWWFRRSAGPAAAEGSEPTHVRELVRDYLPAASAQYLHKVASILEVPVLGLVCGELETGLFAFAAMIAAQANAVIAYQLGLVLQPIFGRLQHDTARQVDGLLRVQRVLGLVCVPIALAQAVAAEPMFRLIFAPRYMPAVTAFQVISLTQAILYALGPLMAFLRSRRQFRTLLVWQTLQLAAGVPACVVGARMGGAAGVAVGHGFVWAVAMPTLCWLALRGTRRRAAPAAAWLFLRPLLATVPVFAVAHVLMPWTGRGTVADLLAIGLVMPLAVAVALTVGLAMDADMRMLARRVVGAVLRARRGSGVVRDV